MDLRDKKKSINQMNEWLFRFRWPLLIPIVALYIWLDSAVVSAVIDKAVEAKLKVNLFFQSEMNLGIVQWKEHLLLSIPAVLFVIGRSIKVHFLHGVLFLLSLPLIYIGLSFDLLVLLLEFGLWVVFGLGAVLHFAKVKRHWVFLLAIPAMFLGLLLLWNIVLSQTAFQIKGSYILLSLLTSVLISELINLSIRSFKLIGKKDYKNGGLIAAFQDPWNRGSWVLGIAALSAVSYFELTTDYKFFLIKAAVLSLVAIWFVVDLFYPVLLSIMPFDKLTPAKSKKQS